MGFISKLLFGIAIPALNPRQQKLKISELELRQIFSQAGLAWDLRYSELIALHGLGRYYEWLDVIYFPESSQLTPFPLKFYTNYHPWALEHTLPWVSADFYRTDSARENFKILVEALREKLGGGQDTTVSNCLQEKWSFENFTLEAMAWPPELNTSAKNTLHEKFPKLRSVARLTITCLTPQRRPDSSLAFIQSIPSRDILGCNAFMGGQALIEVLSPKNPALKLNPEGFKLPDDVAQAFVWRDISSGKIGISSSELTLIQELSKAVALHSYCARPARGSGYSCLSLRYLCADNTTHDLYLSGGSNFDDLSPLSNELANFWGLKELRDEGIDD